MSNKKTTELIHHPYHAPSGFSAPSVPVYKASTVFFPDCAALLTHDWRRKNAYSYGLHGTPTSFVLEERMATLEGGLQTLLVPSGLAAITLVNMAILKQGDEVLIPKNVYAPSYELARQELARFGIHHQLYDPMDVPTLATMLGPRTKLIWLEAPGSITMEFPDLIALCTLAKSRGIHTALDNTWGAGLAFNPFNLDQAGAGVDISIQALTKYVCGGGDVLMGSVTTRLESLHQQIKACHKRMGWGVGGNDIELVLRGLPSLALRYEAQDQSARVLARWWQSRPEITRVLHPALEGAAGHAHWQRISPQHAAGLFSVVFDSKINMTDVHAFVDGLKIFKIGYSWAGPISLAVPYELSPTRYPNGGVLVRFSIGLEAVNDLKADCEQALAKLQNAATSRLTKPPHTA